MSEGRRDKLLIVMDILEALLEKNLKLTHLLYKSNLSHPRLKFYLDECLNKGYIQEIQTKDGKRYRITDEGIEVYNRYRHVRDFSEGFGV